MIEIYLLEQLDAFYKNGSLSKAAEELHISQPALTRSMKRIEQEFGVALFVRDQRKLTLNGAGLKACEYARRILAEEKEMERDVIEEDRKQRIITIGSCSTMASNRLLPMVQQSFPDKSILSEFYEEDTLINRIKNHLAQIVILPERPKDSSLYAQHFIDEQIYISIPNQHPLAKKKVLHSEDLKGLSILAFHIPFWMNRFHKVLPDTFLMVQTDMDVMDELVESKDLLVFNSDQMLKDGYIPEGRVSLPVEEDYARTFFYVCCLQSEKEIYGNLLNSVRAKALR